MNFDQRMTEQVLMDALQIERKTNAYLRDELNTARGRINNLIRQLNYYRNILDIKQTYEVKAN